MGNVSQPSSLPLLIYPVENLWPISFKPELVLLAHKILAGRFADSLYGRSHAACQGTPSEIHTISTLRHHGNQIQLGRAKARSEE